ncbi:hypothetical protein FACS189464_0460 [Bacteroidia bacterium]|nr:hypothetical protein FACS189464_0460 [Bacteroidia bacterium]
MKQRNFLNTICISAAAAVLLLLQPACSKDDASYSPDEMVIDVTQAYMYYFIIFREAETAWAQVHEDGYPVGKVDSTESRKVYYLLKTEIKTEGDTIKKYSIEVDFEDYRWNSTVLSGKITVNLAADSSYTKNDRTTVSLSKFFINRQEVEGFSIISHTRNEETDQYSYTLASGSIYSVDGEDILITSAVSSGVFHRTKGSATTDTPEDDVWTFNGAMTGKIRNTESLKYSNAVHLPPTFYRDCNKKARQGVCTLTVGKQNIFYDYGVNGNPAACDSPIQIETVTHNEH